MGDTTWGAPIAKGSDVWAALTCLAGIAAVVIYFGPAVCWAALRGAGL